MIRFRHRGDFKHTERFFKQVHKISYMDILRKYGQAGVDALTSATPKKTGVTAESWSYEIVPTKRGYSIFWNNSNVQDGVNIALIIQYGHGTGTGGYVQGIDYVNPALRPIFTAMANDAWEEVKNA